MEDTALQTVPNGIEFTGLRAEQKNLGNIFLQSGFFSDVTKGSQAMVKIIAGQELGLEPFSAMQNLFIVKGKIQISGNAIAGKIKSSGKYNYKIKVSTKEVCTLEFYENNEPQGDYTFTIKDATQAGLTSNIVWKNYPQTMLFNRAVSGGYKIFCPDIFNFTVYSEADSFDELQQQNAKSSLIDEIEEATIIEENNVKPDVFQTMQTLAPTMESKPVEVPEMPHNEDEMRLRESLLQQIEDEKQADMFTTKKR
jgi:hypothetical protein